MIVRALLLTLTLVGQVQATWVDIHVGSKHFGTTTKYNEQNWGLGLSKEYGDNYVISIGAYKNSINNTSVYATGTVQTAKYNFIRLGLEAGLVTGYTDTVSPLIAPIVKVYLNDNITLNGRFIPAIEYITPAVASLSIGIRL